MALLIRYFRANYLIHYAVLLFLCVVFWLPSLLRSEAAIPQAYPGTGTLYAIIAGFPVKFPLLSRMVAMIILLVEVYILNGIFSGNDLIPRNSLVTGLVYLVLMSSGTPMLSFNPLLLVNFFLLMAMNLLFRLFSEKEGYEKVFTVSFLIALASMVYSYALVLFIIIPLTFLVYRLFSWREWIISLLGLLIPYLYLFTWYFWQDRLSGIFSEYLDLLVFDLTFASQFTPLTWLIMILIAILGIWSVFIMAGNLDDRTIGVRKRGYSNIWLMLITLLCTFPSGLWNLGNITLLCIPLSGIMGYHFSGLKRFWFAETVFLLLILAIIASNYLPLFR